MNWDVNTPYNYKAIWAMRLEFGQNIMLKYVFGLLTGGYGSVCMKISQRQCVLFHLSNLNQGR